MKRIRIKGFELGAYLCILSLYILPRILRKHFIQGFSSYNILFYIGLFIFIYNYKPKNTKLNISKRLITSVILFSFLAVLIFISHTYGDMYERITYIFVNCVPIFIIRELIDYKSYTFERLANIWYNTLKVVCTILVISWGIDQIIGNYIQIYIANIYKVPSLIECLNNNRFISFYGHSLFNAVLMFSLLLWTLVLYNNTKSVKHYILTIIISVIGIAITGSKSILVLSFLLIVVNFLNKKNLKYIIPLVVIVLTFYHLGVFDLTLNRLFSGIEAGDLSSSRNSSLVRLTQEGILEFNLFKGHYLDDSIEGMISSTEYPIVRWAYKSGIMFATLLTFFYFIIPLYKIKKLNSNNIRFFFSIFLYMLAVNINDGITSNCDALILYIMNICLLNYIVSNKNLNEIQ